ncbi:type III-B CRISPR-associated protein Cas10/Cmr2 [Massilibacterium senegalense]|uniref:type III-B CRISPR-associated protein Cas10/Cmr2 n=1 Tax=Massilibacterium senegalense TaxID=1632858 RepID=UPI000783A270|nr:type III-B CRISPR-associated protein Cas10/Cmr2 [Massilibacterium senegalense]
MSESLLLFTIGPVQQFVEPSRKLKDLYTGSFLLSHLAIVAKKFFEDSGGSIIIPSPNTVNAPNRIIVKLSNTHSGKEIAIAAKQHVQKQFMNISRAIIEDSKLIFSDSVKRQLSHFLEINWVIEPLGLDFKESYIKLMNHMHSVKNTRMFHQMCEPAGRKCDLYEQYNALFTSEQPSRKNLQETKLKDGENLSAIALVKRNFSTWVKSQPLVFDMNVTSVAYMLLKSYLPKDADLEPIKDEGSEALFDFKNQEDIVNHIEYQDKTISAAKRLYDSYGGYIGSPYYAIVKLDGDGVGQKYKAVKSVQEAQKLSEAISDFSKEAKKIIENHQGVCVFAGGEDILAFLPLHTLFLSLTQLITAFAGIKELNNQGTLSAGIIVAHLMSPLKPLLQQVEQLESHAKQIDAGKAAFSMEIMRRGGLSTPLRMKFGKKAANLTIFEDAIKGLAKQEHSNSFVQNIIMIIEPIQNNVTKEMVEALLKKVLRSSLQNKEQVEKQVAVFLNLYEALNEETPVFLHFLQQVSFFARETFVEPKKEEA